MKIPIKKIELLWKEGTIDNYKYPRIFRSMKEFNRELVRNSFNAPKSGGYDKHGFKITWKDGNTYTGRIDVHHPESEYYSRDDVDVKHHMTSWLKYKIKNSDDLQEKKELAEFINKYSLE